MEFSVVKERPNLFLLCSKKFIFLFFFFFLGNSSWRRNLWDSLYFNCKPIFLTDSLPTAWSVRLCRLHFCRGVSHLHHVCPGTKLHVMGNFHSLSLTVSRLRLNCHYSKSRGEMVIVIGYRHRGTSSNLGLS